jgi:hypothetical protein
MATSNVSSMDWACIEPKYINRNLGQSAQETFDEVNEGDDFCSLRLSIHFLHFTKSYTHYFFPAMTFSTPSRMRR